MLFFVLMMKAKSILLTWALLFGVLGGCSGPMMMMGHSMDCCTSMPCSPARQSRGCCTPEVSGVANHLQQTVKVTAPPVTFAVLAMLHHLSAVRSAIVTPRLEIGLHCYSPPGELYTIHHSFLI